MKTSRHSLMAKGIMVLLSLLVLAFAFTYSWYLPPDYPATASGMSITTNASSDFEIAIGFFNDDIGEYVVSDWINGALEFTQIPWTDGNGASHNYDLLNYFEPIDLTSDGINMIRPEMMSKNRDIDTSKTTFEFARENRQYIGFDLIIRTDANSADIKLENTSYVKGKCETSAKDGSLTSSSICSTNNTEYNKSDYGDFSEDSVVGAVRMSFVGYNSNMNDYTKLCTDPEHGNYGFAASPTLLWIPRPDMYLDDTQQQGSWVLHTDRDNNMSSTATDLLGNTRTYSQISSTHYYYDIYHEYNTSTPAAQRYKTVSAVANLPSSGQSIMTIDNTISHTIDAKTYHYNKCRVNIWIEGCDAEARRAIDGGKFTFSFSLSAS